MEKDMTHKIGFNITIIALVAILCVTALEIVAIMNGVNGIAFASTIGLIVGLPTFIITRLISKKE